MRIDDSLEGTTCLHPFPRDAEKVLVLSHQDPFESSRASQKILILQHRAPILEGGEDFDTTQPQAVGYRRGDVLIEQERNHGSVDLAPLEERRQTPVFRPGVRFRRPVRFRVQFQVDIGPMVRVPGEGRIDLTE